ncbi:gamma-glutamylcyclotransferase family protein [Paenibacillus tyrfis]|uniref:Uncharacterized protein n=1 Tax=Paenibacillus tyrfis TaxID=1501230 RepID=A0A081P2T7_9BACL|nr:gamma-glutamylcyclotransferase [Paenibacillus tyrfis]KEQ25010.1 hypothetical protein ET33_04755 [Paenibacillus tyrfis]
MNLFVYGVVSLNHKDNPFISRHSLLLSDEAWVRGVLYDTGLGFPALTSGEDKVSGKLLAMGDVAFETVSELASNFNGMNPPYRFELKSVQVFVGAVTYEALAYMYASGHGLTRIESGIWL